MIKYFYLVPEDDLIFDQVKYSMKSLGINTAPSLAEMIEYRIKCIRCVKDTVGSVCYSVVEMGHNFSNAFKGYKAYSTLGIRAELQDVKYEQTYKDIE